MFDHVHFDIEMLREVDADRLGWPTTAGLGERGSLGGNMEFYDLSGMSWTEAAEVLAEERALIARVERADDPDAELEELHDELAEDPGVMMGLDLGVAATVAALSAAGCIPFSSCNGGAFEGGHHETHPLVVFYARPAHVAALQRAAVASNVGLEGEATGELMVYADNIRSMVAFAAAMVDGRAGSAGHQDGGRH